MKRFWTRAEAVPEGEGWAVALDGKRVRTPAGAALVLPTAALADAVAAEWAAVTDRVNPRAMPLTGLANAALDRAADALVDTLAAYAESDLLCYRAEAPPALVAREAAAWDPPLAWAAVRFDLAFTVVSGIGHRAQPPATLARLRAAVAALSPFARAGLFPVVSVTGSLVLGLALVERAIDAEAAWSAGQVDEAWQAEQWGDDPLAEAAREERRGALMAGARFLALLSVPSSRA